MPTPSPRVAAGPRRTQRGSLGGGAARRQRKSGEGVHPSSPKAAASGNIRLVYSAVFGLVLVFVLVTIFSLERLALQRHAEDHHGTAQIGHLAGKATKAAEWVPADERSLRGFGEATSAKADAREVRPEEVEQWSAEDSSEAMAQTESDSESSKLTVDEQAQAEIGHDDGEATPTRGSATEASQSQLEKGPGLCSWEFHAGKYLGGIAGTSDREISKERAQALCESLAFECAGITCTNLGSHAKCTPRQGTPFLESSPAGEVSFVKQGCEAPDFAGDFAESVSNSGTLARIGPSPEEAGTGPAWEPLSAGRAVIVVVAHNKPDDLNRCLSALLAQDGVDQFSLALSLDDPTAFAKMEATASRLAGSKHHIEPWRKTTSAAAGATATIKIADHFFFALTQAFDVKGYEYAIFLEGDLEVSPDFLWYFRLAGPLLELDPSLFCVSAFHDNGFKGLAKDEFRIFRSDYFPGLGWMIRKETWDLLRHKWPKKPTTGWDHWMRHGAGLEGRECIVPEVPRTKHFGESGTNVKKGTGILRQLERMTASRLPPGKLANLGYLQKDTYDSQLRTLAQESEVRTGQAALGGMQSGQTYVVPYVRETYKLLATQLQIIQSQPRAGHRGVIATRHPRSGAGVLLVDQRRGEGLLPEASLWRPHPSREVGAARPGQSCSDFCGDLGMVCIDKELEYVNECSFLQDHFPCEAGCGHQVGQEIPCYVHERSRDTALQCLVTDDVMPACTARHAATTRLCVCVPSS